MLTTFAIDSTVAVLTDWAELDHLISGRPRSTDSRVVRADRAIDDEPDHGDSYDAESGETVEIEILEGPLEERRQRLWIELITRQQALGDSYPFVVSATSTGWMIETRKGGTRDARIARLAYTVALLTASFKHQHILKQDSDPDTWTALEKEIADRFQALAVLAANNVFGPKTEVYWFGFPRTDHTGFAKALPLLVEKIGHGTIRDSQPYGTESDQDATVDLVAWRSFGDRTYGSLILFGQVASGNNWDSKSIYSHIDDRFFQHFVDPPAKHFLGATFMPFVLHTDTKTPRNGDLPGAITTTARILEISHGFLVDRIRITELMAAGIAEPERRHNAPPACESARTALSWVKKTRLYCEQVA